MASPSFAQFSSLPAELQLEVWKHAASPCTFNELTYDDRVAIWFNLTPVGCRPTLMHLWKFLYNGCAPGESDTEYKSLERRLEIGDARGSLASTYRMLRRVVLKMVENEVVGVCIEFGEFASSQGLTAYDVEWAMAKLTGYKDAISKALSVVDN